MKRAGIDLTVCFDRPLLAGSPLVDLQRILLQLLPNWSSGLHVWRYREPRREITVSLPHHLRDLVTEVGESRGALFQQLAAEHGAGTERRFGSVEVRGSNPSVTVIIEFDSLISPRAGSIYRWGNSISLQVRRKQVEGCDANRWAVEAFARLVDKLSPAYGHGESVDEFESKNIVRNDRGVEAVGVDVSKGLPGIYWLNFFGNLFCSFIGRERLIEARALVTKPLDGGVLVQLGEKAQDWNSPVRRITDNRVLADIGTQYFFEKDAPQRKTIAPSLTG